MNKTGEITGNHSNGKKNPWCLKKQMQTWLILNNLQAAEVRKAKPRKTRWLWNSSLKDRFWLTFRTIGAVSNGAGGSVCVNTLQRQSHLFYKNRVIEFQTQEFLGKNTSRIIR